MINHPYIDDRVGRFCNDTVINTIKEAYGSEQDERDHYIMWSGGTDSTLLLYELLDTYGPQHVHAVSCTYPWLLATKAETERSYRQSFKAMLAAKRPDIANFDHTELHITQETVSGNQLYIQPGNGPALMQAVSWLISMSTILSEKSYIYTGAIHEDDLSFRQEGYHKALEGINDLICKEIILREPYLWLTKDMIIYKLMQYDIYDNTWHCEMPEKPSCPCGKCSPCILHKSSLLKLSLELTTYKVDELIKLKAKNELESLSAKESNKSTYEVETVED
jgi:7-cyano-7-deazaguanine synthase in queuosine biosynthesis